jgi:hypothetical protein
MPDDVVDWVLADGRESVQSPGVATRRPSRQCGVPIGCGPGRRKTTRAAACALRSGRAGVLGLWARLDGTDGPAIADALGDGLQDVHLDHQLRADHLHNDSVHFSLAFNDSNAVAIMRITDLKG